MIRVGNISTVRPQPGTSHSKRRFRVSCVLSLVLCFASVSQSHAALEEQAQVRPKLQSHGVITEKVIFWPALFVEGRFDSNIFRQHPDEQPRGAFFMRARPGITVQNRKGRDFAARFGLIGDVRHYFSSDAAVSEQGRVGGELEGSLDFYPQGTFTIGVFERARHELQAPNVATSGTYDMFRNEAGIKLSLRPGGTIERRPLSFVLGFLNRLTLYPDFERGNAVANQAFFKTTWLFLPKTALTLDATWEQHSFTGEDELGINIDSQPLRATIGLNGLITPKVSLSLKTGWGVSSHESGPSFSNFLGDLQLSIAPRNTVSIKLGVRHDFNTSYLGNYYQFIEGYSELDMTIARSFQWTTQASVLYVIFGQITQPAGFFLPQLNRLDLITRANTRITVPISKIFGVTAGYQFELVQSNYEALHIATNRVDRAAYIRNVIFGSLDIRY